MAMIMKLERTSEEVKIRARHVIICDNYPKKHRSDDAAAYKGIPFDHASVRHSVGEFVDGMVHTNGIESFWSMLKRAHKGVYHKMSAKHLQALRGRICGPPWREGT